MAGFTDLADWVCPSEERGTISCYIFAATEPFPIYISLITSVISYMSNNIYPYFITLGIYLDRIVNMALMYLIIGSFDYDHEYSSDDIIVPSITSQSLLFITVTVLVYIILYKKWPKTWIIYFYLLFVWLQITGELAFGMQTQAQSILGAMVGIITALIYNVFIFIFIKPYLYIFTDSKYAKWLAMDGSFM